jgi:tRNA(fMet)-specific endonuclease VapC
MALFILDTGILLGVLKASAYASASFEHHGLNTPDAEVVVSVVSQAELRAFPLRNGWGAEKIEKLEALLRRIPAVDISQPRIVGSYAEIKVFSEGGHPRLKLPASAYTIGDNDLWIAATAHVLRAHLLTTDKDFAPLEGVFIKHSYYDPKGIYS